MNFREYAETEASASLRGVRAGTADVCRQQLAALRAAVDAAANALDENAHQSAQTDSEIAGLVERLTSAAATAADLAASQVSEEAHRIQESLQDEANKIQESLQADLQAQIKQNAATAAALREAQGQADAFRIGLKDAQAHGESLRSGLKDAQAQTNTLRNELESAQAQADVLRVELDESAKHVDALGRELEKARESAAQLEGERRDLTTARDAEKQARAAAEGDLRKTTALLEKTRGEVASLARTLEEAVEDKTAAEDAAGVAQSQAQAADAKLAAVTDLLKTHASRVKVLERTQQDHERTIKELQSRKPSPQQGADTARATLSVFEDLLGAFEALGTATTISDVLTTMVEHMATEFSRVALFRVKSNHLQGEHQIGFDLKTDISKVIIPLGMDSVLTKAAASGSIEQLSGDELAEGNRVPFSGKPSFAIALPVAAGGETLAIVYADDSGGDHGSDAGPLLRVHFADAMRQHAVSVLTRMKAELKALAELRTYAGSLLQEIEAMYVADTASGTEGKELQARLKVHLDYARSIYANRASLEDAEAGNLLDDAISAVVEEHQDARYRHDLAAASGHSPSVRQKRAAEAS
jgi:hypothetical protein